MTIEVGHLSEVPLREVWAGEASVFTPWLADNPHHLSEVLGMDLELEGTEVAVGPFSADVVLRDATSGHRVIVENFLEATDHDHLGKLIRYTAGLEGSYAVLVARTFRPEHRTALTWLNSVSTSEAGFFGVEVRAVRIGDSMPAVLLDVVVAPDDWQKHVRETASGQLSEGQARYRDWWAEFLPAVKEMYPGWTSASAPSVQNWINLPSGRSGFRYGVSFAYPHDSYSLRVELYIDDGAVAWSHFAAHRVDVDAAVPGPVSWEELRDSKASRIAVYLSNVDPDDRSKWPQYRAWAIEQLGLLRTTLQPIIQSLPSS